MCAKSFWDLLEVSPFKATWSKNKKESFYFIWVTQIVCALAQAYHNWYDLVETMTAGEDGLWALRKDEGSMLLGVEW